MPEFGQGLPPAGGWKRHMIEDPTEFSPEYQEEYRRLWHEAAAERDQLRRFVGRIEVALEEQSQTGDYKGFVTAALEALRLLSADPGPKVSADE